jgi:hypothetical protein
MDLEGSGSSIIEILSQSGGNEKDHEKLNKIAGVATETRAEPPTTHPEYKFRALLLDQTF